MMSHDAVAGTGRDGSGFLPS